MAATEAKSLGNWGEQLAREYLEERGYRFMASNWSCKAGEIDLIMQHQDSIVFVEVRLRRRTQYGAGADTVAWQKQHKLIKTAHWYLQSTNQHRFPARFDVVSIEHESGQNPKIEHIEYAFEAS